MLTDNKEITKPDYWDSLYTGKRNNAKVDSSNGKRATTFDRFTPVVELVEGEKVLEVAAGHARISFMVKVKYPEWEVIAGDQSTEALKVSPFRPYSTFSVYQIPFADKYFDTVICTQAFEYFDDLDKAIIEFKRVSKYGVFSFPNGEMGSWSQLYIFTPEYVQRLVLPYGTIEKMTTYEHLIVIKIKFYEV